MNKIIIPKHNQWCKIETHKSIEAAQYDANDHTFNPQMGHPVKFMETMMWEPLEIKFNKKNLFYSGVVHGADEFGNRYTGFAHLGPFCKIVSISNIQPDIGYIDIDTNSPNRDIYENFGDGTKRYVGNCEDRMNNNWIKREIKELLDKLV